MTLEVERLCWEFFLSRVKSACFLNLRRQKIPISFWRVAIGYMSRLNLINREFTEKNPRVCGTIHRGRRVRRRKITSIRSRYGNTESQLKANNL